MRVRSLVVDGHEVDGTLVMPLPAGRDVAVEGSIA